MSLRKIIRQILQANPVISNQELFEQVRPQFPHDNESWLRRYIKVERSKFKTAKEKAFLSGRVGV